MCLDSPDAGTCRHGNKYYENMNETLWRHRWVDYASVRPFLFFCFLAGCTDLGARRKRPRADWTDTPNHGLRPFVQHDYNASQVSSEWHAWIQHTRHEPPTSDIVLQEAKRPWQIVRSPAPLCYLQGGADSSLRSLLAQPHFENLTGTRGGFKTYSTTKHKIANWEPTVSARP